jgi:hypothetical protein
LRLEKGTDGGQKMAAATRVLVLITKRYVIDNTPLMDFPLKFVYRSGCTSS